MGGTAAERVVAIAGRAVAPALPTAEVEVEAEEYGDDFEDAGIYF